MATRSHVTDNSLPSVDENVVEGPSFPTPLDEEPEVDTSNELGELLYSSSVDTKALADTQSELYLERGDYIWEMPTLVLRIGSNDADRESSDIFARKGLPKGRCMVNVFGVVKPFDARGKGGRFNFSFSPDKRYRRDQQGNLVEPVELDMFSKVYVQLTEFFFQTKERQIRSEGEVIDLVKSGLYRMYITKSKAGGNFLGQFKELGAQR